MKKLIFIILLNLLIVTLSFSQDTNNTSPKEFSLEFSAAFNKPTGKYFYQYGNDNEGFAKNGIYLNFAAKQIINSFCGIKLAVGGMLNPVNASYFHLNVFEPDVSYSIGKWFNFNISAGVVFYLMNDNNIFEITISPCLLNASSPQVTYSKFEDGVIIYQNNYERGSGLNIGFNPEFSLIQNIGNNKQLKISLSYIYSKVNIEYENSIYFENEDEEFVWIIHEKTRIVNIGVLNIGAGIIF